MQQATTQGVAIRVRSKIMGLALVCALLGVAGFTATAQAKLTYESSFGGSGEAAGQFQKPAGVAVNTATGDVYVADYGNNRIEQFNEDGAFIRAWGFGVVASGEDDQPSADEVEEVKIRATGGSFTLEFEGESTPPIKYDAAAAEVQAALNGLAKINEGGGSVDVSGGVGDASGSNPYVVEFNGGPLKERDVSLTIDATALSLPSSTELSCEGSGSYQSSSYTYQWLADGVAVPGATSATFTPGSGEAGKAIQCQVFAQFPGPVAMVSVTAPYVIGPGPSGVRPPLMPMSSGSENASQLEPPESSPSTLPVGESAGSTLTCHANPWYANWSRNPESFTYRWYRNGQEIAGSAITTTETTNTYTLTAADTAEKAHFQCSVTGTNAGGASIAFSGVKSSEPKPQGSYPPKTILQIPADRTSRIITATNGGPGFEICEANPPSDDVCKAGVPGSALGEFNRPRSIAVDNSPGGDGAVYVHDEMNFRVQKFTSEGEPILEFGQEVDEATEADICEAASMDPCGGGTRAVDESLGSIGYEGPVWYEDSAKEHVDLGNQLAVDQAGHVYLGEIRRSEEESDEHTHGCPNARCAPRIQKWNPDGTPLSFAPLGHPPLHEGERVEERHPVSLVVNSEELVYVTYAAGGIQGLQRVYPEEFGPTGGTEHPIGNLFETTAEPRQTALDPRNDRLLVSDLNEKETFGSTEPTSVCGGPRDPGRAVIEFDANLHRIDCTVPLADGHLPRVTGMSVNGQGRLYAASGPEDLVKIFHLPVPAKPEIAAESAKRTTSGSSDLHAQINPGFEETNYRVEYGLGDCASSSCQTVDGTETLGGLHFSEVIVKISGLQPETTYHYRFVAENALGEVKGPDRTFTTYQLVDLVNDPCANALARKQTRAAGLLDCRAYELVSAGWTGGYDVVSSLVPGQTPFDGYPDATDKVLYGVKDGGIPGTGNPTNRGIDPYVAERSETGWTTRYVGIPSDNPFATGPFSSTLAGATPDLSTFAFGGPDICSPCFDDGSSGVPVRMPDGELVQGMAGSESHPEAERAGFVPKPLTADGKHLIFGSTSAFVPGAVEGDATLYERNLEGAPNTEIVSTDSSGEPMTGEVGELDVSSDGSRVVVAEKVGTDGAGNPLWHPYLHVRGTAESIDLAPGTTTGVYFNGMTRDGSTIFFSTVDRLPVAQATQDEDESIDVYRAEVGSGGNLTLDLLSVNSDGTASNYDGCEPPGEPNVWNAIEGEGKCNTVAFAGGAGVAVEDGTFYFVSPEQLESGEGIENQANLYVVHPGGEPKPEFVALIDSSLEKPGPPAPTRPIVTEKFANAEWTIPGELTVDQSNGDLYVVEAGLGEGAVYRYAPNGAPDNFTAGPGEGTEKISGFTTGLGSINQIAVDNSPASAGGPLQNALYVPDGSGVHVFAQSGASLGLVNGSGTSQGSFGRACGVAVDQSTGALYVADRSGFIWQYTPNGPSGTIEDSDYTVKGVATKNVEPCSIAVDTLGNVYAAAFKEFSGGLGAAYRWSASSFASSPPTVTGTELGTNAGALSTDPATNELYVDAGKFIKVFSPAGDELESFGNGKLTCTTGPFSYYSRGVAVSAESQHVFASCFDNLETYKGTVREWGFEQSPYIPVDNPAIVHGVNQPEVHTWGDFQVTPSGNYAAFASVVPLKEGYDNGGKSEVYRYTNGSGELLCVSCDPTESQASTDSVLPPSGLGLLEDGRLFFNSGEALTLSDTNEELDAYEWSPKREGPGACGVPAGCQRLISTGASAYPSGLLGVTANGKDAFFFTRDVLVPEDKNEQAMKIYDAREGGGFFVVPPPPPCAASDECHGPGTEAPGSPQIGTFKGTGGQARGVRKPRRCKKGFRKKHGKCVRKREHRKHHHRKGAGRGGKGARQGGSR
jgi:hypothetical protein